MITELKNGEKLHEDYVREVEGATSAVVFIHGILSTPLFFERLVSLVPENFSVYNILLDGHGGAVKDFSETSMKVWKHQVKTLMKYLTRRYESIILVGHSMGTLFSIQNAACSPEKIKALFLLCSPLKVRVHPRSAKYSLRIIFEKKDVGDPVENSARGWYSIKPDKKLWKYIPWVPKFASLLSEIRKTRAMVKDLTVKTYAFHAKNDSLVSNRATKFYPKTENFKLTVLENSYHQYFEEEDYKIILSSFRELFN